MIWMGWKMFFVVAVAVIAESVSAAEGDEVLATIRVPDGFVVERVAGPPLVDRPIMASFDDRGRLFVIDSAGVNLPGNQLLKNPPHRIVMLEDTDGDGRFDKSTVFADKLVFPQGIQWHDGAVFISSPPSFWKLEDTDGDGVADKRTELVTGFTNTGVADDLHGSCLGPDGRIYWCAGRFPHRIKLLDGSILRKGTSPLILRCKPDGTEVEAVCGALGNPVEVAFTDEGEAIASGTFMAADPHAPHLERADGLIHCIEGGDYSVLDKVIHEHKRTGDFLPALTQLGVSANAGVMRYHSDAWGLEWHNNFFSAQFNLHKVTRHVVMREGATFRCRNENFVVSKNLDVHFTDVLEDADGSLLVVDTGGWFRIGCPTSQIAKPDIKGAIYRVRKQGAPIIADPRGLALVWEKLDAPKLVALLDDSRFAVRDRAIGELAKKGAASLDALKTALSHPSAQLRRNAVWTLCRIDGAPARDLTRLALTDKEASVRQTATYVVGLHRDAAAKARLMELVRNDSPPIRREAATALGRIRPPDAIPALLDGLRLPAEAGAGGDRFLEHALLFSLIQIANRDEMIKSLADASPVIRRGALIALDQMEGGNLTPELVAPLLDPIDPALQKAALDVIANRPTWGKEILGLVQQWLVEEKLDGGRADNLRRIVVAFCRDAPLQDAVALALRSQKTSVATRLLLLEAINEAPLEKLPPTWAAEARWSLDSSDERVVRQSLMTLRATGAKEFDQALLRLARDENRAEDLRLNALAAAVPQLEKLERPLFNFLVSALDKEKPPLTRLTAAQGLGCAPLDDAQLTSLVGRVSEASPLELPKLLPAFERSKDEKVGKKLVAALEQASALPSVTADALRAALKNFPDAVRQQAEPLLQRVTMDIEAQRARLAELEPVLSGGSAAHGREIFFGKKASCTACHSVAGQGGHVGPDLSKVGAIRAPRDLLEAIVFPSASFVRGFEPYTVQTTDGDVQSGTLARETAEAIYLNTGPNAQARIARSAIKELRPSAVSIMPQGLDAQLSHDELADLIAFLLSLR